MADGSGFAHVLNINVHEGSLLRGKTLTCCEGFAE